MRRSLAGMLLAVVLAATVIASAADARVRKGFYGVVPQTKLTEADFKRMRAGNIGVLRTPLPWGDIDQGPTEESPVAPHYTWTKFDGAMIGAAKNEVRVLPTVYGLPSWLAGLQGCAANCFKLGPSTISSYVGFSLFMRAAVERYGPGGTFWRAHPGLPYLPINTWQIWNEQNSSDFWAPFPNVEDYKNLVIAGGDAVHSVDPQARVILGGMLPDPSQNGKSTVTAWSFFLDLYADPRSRAAFDGVAIHPYGASLRSIKRTMWKVRTELRADGGGSDPVWITEIGWASGGEPNPLNRGPKGQAQLISEVFDFFTRKRKAFNVVNVDYYAWRDGAPNGDYCAWCRKSGLFPFHSLRPKPAWHALTEFTLGR
jgi:polysaccharide biosynthesis protein PslG